MTKEEKQLLLMDLCARLPYGPQIHINSDECDDCFQSGEFDNTLRYHHLEAFVCDRIEIKPYLRPMLSITEEEKKELRQEHIKDEKLYAECLTKAANGDDSMRGKVIPHFAADWCNKNHFDFRGLIEKDLALEASEGMY